MIDSDLTDISLDSNCQDYKLKVGPVVYNLDWVGSFFTYKSISSCCCTMYYNWLWPGPVLSQLNKRLLSCSSKFVTLLSHCFVCWVLVLKLCLSATPFKPAFGSRCCVKFNSRHCWVLLRWVAFGSYLKTEEFNFKYPINEDIAQV